MGGEAGRRHSGGIRQRTVRKAPEAEAASVTLRRLVHDTLYVTLSCRVSIAPTADYQTCNFVIVPVHCRSVLS